MSGGTESFGSVSVHVSVDVFRFFQLIFGVVLRHAAESKLGDFAALDAKTAVYYSDAQKVLPVCPISKE